MPRLQLVRRPSRVTYASTRNRQLTDDNFADATCDSSERTIAERSVLLKNMLEDIGENAGSQMIPVPNVRTSLHLWRSGQLISFTSIRSMKPS